MKASEARQKSVIGKHKKKNKELKHVFLAIKSAADKGKFHKEFYDLEKNTIKVLKEKGYKVQKYLFSGNYYMIRWSE